MSEQRFAEMISMMAHELRSPLTSVKGFSATLVKKWDRFTDDQRREFIEAIHHDAERMARIVTEVLDLARAESGRLELTLVEADLAELVKEALLPLESVQGFDRVTIDIPPDVRLKVDKDRVSSVFHNLVENAIRFSDSGPVEVTASRAENQIQVAVADRGVGIEPARLGEVLGGPGPHGQTVTPKGSGLGLYLSRLLIEAHRGSIIVASQPDEGAVFTVTLPDER